MSIEEAFSRVKRGDEKAFEYIYKEYFSRLCVLSVKVVGSSTIAEDIVQQVFFNLWEKRNTITIEKSIGGYLARSTYNLSLEYLRRSNIHTKHHGIIFENSFASDEYFEQQIEIASDDETINMLRQGMEQLPEQCKSILIKSRFEDKKSSDIALEMGLSVRTVENQLYIGLKKLKDFVKGK